MLRLVRPLSTVEHELAIAALADMARELWPSVPRIALFIKYSMMEHAANEAQEAAIRLSDWTSDEAPRTGRDAGAVYFDAIEVLGAATRGFADSEHWATDCLPSIGLVVDDWLRLSDVERDFAVRCSAEYAIGGA